MVKRREAKAEKLHKNMAQLQEEWLKTNKVTVCHSKYEQVRKYTGEVKKIPVQVKSSGYGLERIVDTDFKDFG